MNVRGARRRLAAVPHEQHRVLKFCCGGPILPNTRPLAAASLLVIGEGEEGIVARVERSAECSLGLVLGRPPPQLHGLTCMAQQATQLHDWRQGRLGFMRTCDFSSAGLGLGAMVGAETGALAVSPSAAGSGLGRLATGNSAVPADGDE